MFKFYLNQGIEITKVYKIITFKEEAWLKKYIDFNTEQRTIATKNNDNFGKNIWKLMNNSFYGKTIENQRNRIDFQIVDDEKILQKNFNKPQFKDCIYFNDNCLGVLNKKVKTELFKPIYLGCSVLDLSKLLMYRYYYNCINNLWNNTEVIGKDTDALILNIKSKDIYRDMRRIKHTLDTSEYPKDHKLYSNKNEKVIGKFKDELNSKIIEEIIFVKSKVYAFKVDEKEKKLIKGCSKPVKEKDLTYDEYDKILNSYDELKKKQYQIHSQKHNIFFEQIDKNVMCAFDDKRYLVDSKITLPHCDEETISNLFNLMRNGKR